jgi:hypothetical protein
MWWSVEIVDIYVYDTNSETGLPLKGLNLLNKLSKLFVNQFYLLTLQVTFA